MEVAAYSASILIGISLGLIGGGGSILTVPVLVYLFRIDAVLATAYSLFIVGITSVVGSFSYFRKGLVDLKVSIVFGLPSIAAVFITRAFVIPIIPNEVVNIGNFVLSKGIFLLLFFALLMIFASYSMIKKEDHSPCKMAQKEEFNHPFILLQGILIGTITGLIGAGGGFLIIPVLVNFLKLPMKKAVGTSLFIIAVNSLIGFVFSLHHTFIQWNFLLSIVAITTIGILIGGYFSSRIDGKKLKPAFGWFVLVMGIYIIVKEAILN